MVTGETKSFFSFAKSVSQRCSLSSAFEGNTNLLLSSEHIFKASENVFTDD